MRTPSTLAGYAFAIFPVLIWGGTYRAVTIANKHASAFTQNGLRSGIAAVLLVSFVLLRRTRLPRGRVAFWSAVSGLLMVVIAFEGFTEGTIRAGAGNAAVLTSTSPLFVLVFARAFLGERVPWLGAVGMALGFSGTVVMVSSQLRGAHGGSVIAGMLIALASGVSWAAGTLLVKWLAETNPDLDLAGVTAVQYIVGGIILVSLAFAVKGTGGTDWSSRGLWEPILYVAAGSSGIATISYFAALKRLPATTVSAWSILVPVVAVTIEAVRGNPPGGLVLGGMALAFCGVALVNLAPLLRSGRLSPALASGE